MPTFLSTLESPRGQRPIIVTLVGEGGMGKTTLAASFPDPIIIRVEDGTASLTGREDVALTPLMQSSQGVIDALTSLGTEEHPFRTVIIDSVTQLNTLIESEVVASDPKAKSINQAMGGYGAGQSAVSERHRMIREFAGRLQAYNGMNVVFIAHAESETLELPDADPYTRYTIRMHRKSVSHYSDNVDLVGFIKLKTFTTGESDKKRAHSDGSRIMTCYPTPSHISKNRFGIKRDLPFIEGENPLAPYIPTATTPAAQAA